MRSTSCRSLRPLIFLCFILFSFESVLSEDINRGDDPDIPDDAQGATVTAKIGSNDAWMNTIGTITRSGVFGDASLGSGSVEASVLGDGLGLVRSKTTALNHMVGQTETHGNSCQSLKPIIFGSDTLPAGSIVTTDVAIHFDGLLTVKEEVGGGSTSQARVEYMAEIQEYDSSAGERVPVTSSPLDGVAWITDDGSGPGGVSINVPETYQWMEDEPAGQNSWYDNSNLSILKVVPSGTVSDPSTEIDVDNLPSADARTQANADMTAGRSVYYLVYDDTITFDAEVGKTYYMAMDLQTAAGCMGGSGAASYAQSDFSNTIRYTFSGSGLNLQTGVFVEGDETVGSADHFGGSSSMATLSNANLNWSGAFGLSAEMKLAAGTTNTFNTGAFDPTVSGDFSGSGTLVKTGTGTLALTGDLSGYTGSIFVNQGTLQGDLSIASGATLGGIGTVVGNVSGAGRVAPGNSIGTLSITGNYTPSAGSVLEVEVDNSASDRLAVTGTADVRNATLRAVPLERITEDREYRFLTAGTVTGPFSALDTAVLDFTTEIRAGGTEYWLLVDRQTYLSATRTANQAAVARALDTDSGSASGDLAVVLGSLDTLGASELRDAFGQMGGDIYGSLSVISRDNTSFLYGMLADRLRSRRETPSPACATGFEPLCGSDCGARCGRSAWTGWISGYGRGGSAGSDGNAHGFDYSLGGVTASIGRALDYDSQFGLFYNYGRSYVTSGDHPRDSADIDTHHWGAYFKKSGCDRYLIFASGFGYDSYRTDRGIQFGSIARTARSAHDGWQSSIYAEYGGMYDGDVYSFQPFVGLNYIYVRQNGLNETGADSLDLNVGGNDLNALRTVLGGRLVSNRTIEFLDSPTMNVDVFWTHDLLNRVNGAIDASLDGGAAFAISGVDLGRDWVTVAPGLTWQLGPHCRLFADYNLAFNSHVTYHAGRGALEFTW